MSWNLAISLFFAITVAFSLVIGRARVVMILLAAYAGIAVSTAGGQIFTEVAAKLFAGATLFVVQSVFFAAITLLLVLKGEFSAEGSGPRSIINTLMTGAYGFLLAGLALSTIFSFMLEADLNNLFALSPLAVKVNSVHFWWLILPVILMVSASFFSKPTESSSK